MQGPPRPPWGHKPPLNIANMELMDFPAGVPTWPEFAQLIFMLPIVVPMPAAQFEVVILATDLRTPAQYNGMMAEVAKTVAASKGKQRVVPTKEDDSNCRQLSSEEEEEEEEGEMPTQRFQHVQQNKKLAKKKHLDTALQDRMMRILLDNPVYWDIPNPIQRPEDMAFVCLHIPARFLHTKDDATTVLRVMRAPDPKRLFDLKQIAQYALIYGWPRLENTWQGIAVDFAYCMHWRTLFEFALCRALCANSAGKTTIVRWFALFMARPGLYQEAVATYAAANPM
ncbi:hypothetical protein C0992_009716 [Termitomyces sp. T32_za158]|nr:hypothetical protein C0992_009716 [Termitomyces sp. T32_za158]